MNIAIYGQGYVGKAVKAFFERKYKVFAYDPEVCPSKTNDFVNADMAVICVPTPQAPDGSCDTTIVEEVVKDCKAPLILCKSTVAPGTTKGLKSKYGKRIVFSPEYIGESSYYTPEKYMHPTEMVRHPFQIFGGDKTDTSAMVDIFVPIMGPHVTYWQTDETTAEIIKYWENSWLAMKVTFANEMYEICNAFGVDYWTAREGWALDNRVEKLHSAVFKDKRGYGGKCFPKDISAIVHASAMAGYQADLLMEVMRSNKRFQENA